VDGKRREGKVERKDGTGGIERKNNVISLFYVSGRKKEK
jgi:hypothetical protein